jgi:hypothetical protein
VGAEIASRVGWCSDGQSEYFLNLGKRNLANNMKQIFEMKLFKRLASVSVVAAYALSSGLCYAQQATPAPSPTLATAGEGKETK